MVSSRSAIRLHDVKGTHWECPVNRLFVSMMSRYSLGVSSQSSICFHDVKGTHWVASCQSFICLHDVRGTHWGCLFNSLFVSKMSRLPIGVLLSIVFLSPRCQGTHWVVYFQPSICPHDVMGTHLGV